MDPLFFSLKLLPTKDEPEQFAVKKENGSRHDPGDNYREGRVRELPHFAAVACELNQGDDRKRQLKAKHDLTEDKQRGNFAFAGDADDQNGWKNSDRAGNQTAQPRLKTNLQKPFHDDL